MNWYISRELQKLGWKADVISFEDRKYNYLFHGEDLQFDASSLSGKFKLLLFLIKSIFNYDAFVFANGFINRFHTILLRTLGKKIIYVTSGCKDGCLRSSFNNITGGMCDKHCGWNTALCNDSDIKVTSEERNKYSDIIYAPDPFLADFNNAPQVELPFYYCVNTDFWHPDVYIPSNHMLWYPDNVVKIFHSMANMDIRQHDGKNEKGTHEIYAAVQKLKSEGYPVEMIFVTDVSNKDLRYYIAQSDIVVDQLRYGWFGAQSREALSMGKPVIANIYYPWLEKMQSRLPDYNLPIVHSDEKSIYDVLKSLVTDDEMRKITGKKSRDFALKWLDCKVVSGILDKQWTALINGQRLLLRDSTFHSSLISN